MERPVHDLDRVLLPYGVGDGVEWSSEAATSQGSMW
jgi:hypothetical protein